MFQSYALFPHMSVFDNVAFGLRMQKVPVAELTPRVEEALRMVQLDAFAKRRPGQLSGGQQQRVAIARAVVNKPKVLLLDESLSALDYKLRKQMQNELKALQRKLGITFVFVTHDQEEALTMSDRIVVMREGRIEQDGTPREIYEEPKNLFVASFIGEINIFDAVVLQRLDPQRVRANVEGRECDIYADLPVEPGQKLKVLLRPEDLRVEEVNDSAQHDGLIGYVRERNYKGMTLESVVELESGKTVMVSEFFNEDDPDVDHSLNQKMAVTGLKAGRWCWPMKKSRKVFQNVVIVGVVARLLLFVFMPNLMIIATSFLTRDDANLVQMVFTLDNYRRLFDPLYARAAALAEHGAGRHPVLPGDWLSVRLYSGAVAAEGAAAAAVSADRALLDQLADPHLRPKAVSQHPRLSQRRAAVGRRHRQAAAHHVHLGSGDPRPGVYPAAVYGDAALLQHRKAR